MSNVYEFNIRVFDGEEEVKWITIGGRHIPIRGDIGDVSGKTKVVFPIKPSEKKKGKAKPKSPKRTVTPKGRVVWELGKKG